MGSCANLLALLFVSLLPQQAPDPLAGLEALESADEVIAVADAMEKKLPNPHAEVQIVRRLAEALDRVGEAERAEGLLREVVVVDGGSRDGTLEAAATWGTRVVTAPRGRGAQLSAGAAAARGEWLLFLHADTRLAPGWVAAAFARIFFNASRAALRTL